MPLQRQRQTTAVRDHQVDHSGSARVGARPERRHAGFVGNLPERRAGAAGPPDYLVRTATGEGVMTTRTDIDFPFRIDERGRTADVDYAGHVGDMVKLLLFTRPGERVMR